MDDFRKHFGKEIEDLKQLGRELKAQAKDAKIELDKGLTRLEEKWPEVDSKIREVEKQASASLEKAAKDIASELKVVYERLRQDFGA